jgi:hypothetical protein
VTAREKAMMAVAVLLLVVVAFVAYQWLQEHDAKIKSDAKSTAIQNTITVNAQAISDARKDFADAAADQKRTIQTLQQQLVIIQSQRAAVPTPQQFVLDASKLIPNLPAPLKVQEVPATAGHPAEQEVVIPKQDLQALHNYKLDCDEKAARLTACQQNASDDGTKILALTAELTKTDDDYQLMTKDRDGWRNTARGGTLWHRTISAGKWVLVGSVVGYAASRAAH